MSSPHPRPVVVGVDGRPGSAGAIRFAVAQARRRSAPLLLAHVIPDFLGLGPPVPLADLRRVGSAILAQERTAVLRLADDLDIGTVLAQGERSACIVQAAAGAGLVVVGRETRGGFERLLTGATTAGVAAHASCDIVVVPSFWTEGHPRGRVVAGVKSRKGAHGVLAQAFAEAAARGATLVVVMAWRLADPYFDRIEARTHAEDWARNGERMLEEATAEWRAAYPEVPVEIEVVHGAPARVLLAASGESDLLVVSRRRFPLPPYGHLGGVGHSLLRLSEVPVHVVPCDSETESDSSADAQDLVLEDAGVGSS